MFQAIARDFEGNNLLTALEYSIEAIRSRAFAEFVGWDACHSIDIVDLSNGTVVDTIDN